MLYYYFIILPHHISLAQALRFWRLSPRKLGLHTSSPQVSHSVDTVDRSFGLSGLRYAQLHQASLPHSFLARTTCTVGRSFGWFVRVLRTLPHHPHSLPPSSTHEISHFVRGGVPSVEISFLDLSLSHRPDSWVLPSVGAGGGRSAVESLWARKLAHSILLPSPSRTLPHPYEPGAGNKLPLARLSSRASPSCYAIHPSLRSQSHLRRLASSPLRFAEGLSQAGFALAGNKFPFWEFMKIGLRPMFHLKKGWFQVTRIFRQFPYDWK